MIALKPLYGEYFPLNFLSHPNLLLYLDVLYLFKRIGGLAVAAGGGVGAT